MGRFLRIFGYAVAGFVGAFVLAATLGVLFLLPADGGGDAGGRAMSIFFALGPAAGIIGAIAGIVFALTRPRKPTDPPAL